MTKNLFFSKDGKENFKDKAKGGTAFQTALLLIELPIRVLFLKSA